MLQPESYVDFEVYDADVGNLVGVSNVTPPNIEFLTQTITGAGIGGSIEAVIIGMTNAMTCTMNFRSVTDSATKLASPVKHTLDLRVAEQYWETVAVEKQIHADRFVMVVVPKNTSVGQVSPATTAAVSGEYTVYRYEAYDDGVELWCIDPFNYVCRINGVDYSADIRAALGKN